MKGIFVSVVLPLGISANKFFIHVHEGGCQLLITLAWTAHLIPAELHEKWFRAKGFTNMEKYHPNILGFRKRLKSIVPTALT